MVVKELFARLGLDVESSGFTKADGLLAGLDKALFQLGAVATAAAAGIAVLVKQTANAGDDAKVAAARLGISTAAVQELGYAAEQSDTSIESLQQAFTFLGKKGVKDVDAAFADIAEKFAAMPNDGARLKFAFDALGKAGKDLAPLLAEGADGLAALRAEARDMGLVLDSDAVEAGDRFNDTLGRLGKRLEGLRNRLLAPWLAKFERGLVRVEKAVISLSDVLAEAFAESVKWANVIGLAFASVFAAMAVAAGPAIAAWVAVAAPIALLAATLFMVGLILEDLYVGFTGGKSIILPALKAWGQAFADWARGIGDQLKYIAREAGVWIRGLGIDLVIGVANIVDGWVKAFTDFFTWIADQFGVMAAKAMSAFEAPLKALRSLFGSTPPPPPVGPEGAPTADASGASMFGGGASPTASAAASPSGAITVAPSFNASFSITTQPGQSPGDVAAAVRAEIEQWNNVQMRQTLAAVS